MLFRSPLRAEKWRTAETIYWRADRNDALREMTDVDKGVLEGWFADNKRTHVLTGP